MSDPIHEPETGQSASQPDDELLWADLQALLLRQERARVHELEEEILTLQGEIERLRRQLTDQEESVVPTVTGSMSQITDEAVQTNRPGMARALGPIIGEAIRVQIRDSREELIEALYPIIGDTVMRAIAERFREFQRQIDARIRPRAGFLDNFSLRLRGVTPAEIALRDALPFEVNQLFLIRHESGLVIAHYARDASHAADSDLISGMLTAIQAFMEDSFDPDQTSDEDLDSIYHGDANIILQSGSVIYAAAVVDGTEPAGFRSAMRSLLSELNVAHREAFEEYSGDPDTIPDLNVPLTQWVETVESGGLEETISLESTNKTLARLAAFLGVVVLLACCFLAWFVWRLMPFALGSYEPLPPIIATVVVTATPRPTEPPTATPTAAVTITPSPTVNNTPTSTSTSLPTSTPTAAPTLTPTPQPLETSPPTANLLSNTIGSVWSRLEPDLNEPTYLAIPAGVNIDVLVINEEWALVRWEDNQEGMVEGWIPLEWVELSPSDTIEGDSE